MTDSRAAHAHPPAYSVDIQGVSQHFMQGDTRIDVLKNIDLKVRYGEVVAILGPSGSGKSTLLNILGLLSTPASGSYLLDGTDTATFNAARREAFIRLFLVIFYSPKPSRYGTRR